MTDCGIDRLAGIIYSMLAGERKGQGGKSKAQDWSVASMKEAMKKAEDGGSPTPSKSSTASSSSS